MPLAAAFYRASGFVQWGLSGRKLEGSRRYEAFFGALAMLGNARAELDHHPLLEVLDREASFFSFFSPHPEVPLLSIAIDGRLSKSAATR